MLSALLLAAALACGGSPGAFAATGGGCDHPLPAPYLIPRHEQRLGHRIESVERSLRARQYETIGLGDSIMQLWPTYLIGTMFGRPALNAGIGADRIEQLLWRLDHMSFADQNPKKVVVLIGTNDLPQHASACAIANGILQVVARVHAMWPKALVYVSGILPRGPALARFRAEIDDVNAQLRAAADTAHFTFVDFGAPFRQACGNSRDCPLFREAVQLHPSPEGYRAMANVPH